MDVKKRSTNFNAKEESLLVLLVKKYKDILECKMTDMRTHSEKAECWKKIESEFNGTSGEVYRPKEVLRKKYDNIKKRVKKKYADEKCYARGTGGGPPEEIKFTDVDKDIKEILGVRIEGNQSEFDGDSENINMEIADNPLHGEYSADVIQIISQENVVHDVDQCIDSIEIEEVPFEEHNYNKIESQSSSTANPHEDYETKESNLNVNTTWAKYTPNLLRKKKSQCLVVSNNEAKKRKRDEKSISEKVSQWAEAKNHLEEAKQKFLSEEQQLKLQFMREKHEQEMKIAWEKAELEKKLMEEQHRVKMEILEIQKAKLKR